MVFRQKACCYKLWQVCTKKSNGFIICLILNSLKFRILILKYNFLWDAPTCVYYQGLYAFRFSQFSTILYQLHRVLYAFPKNIKMYKVTIKYPIIAQEYCQFFPPELIVHLSHSSQLASKCSYYRPSKTELTHIVEPS